MTSEQQTQIPDYTFSPELQLTTRSIIRDGGTTRSSLFVVSAKGMVKTKKPATAVVKIFPPGSIPQIHYKNECKAIVKLGIFPETACNSYRSVLEEGVSPHGIGSLPFCFGTAYFNIDKLRQVGVPLTQEKSRNAGWTSLIYQNLHSLPMLERQHLTDDMFDAIMDAYETMKSKGVLYQGAINKHSWPKVECSSIRVYKNPATGINEPIFIELGVSKTFDPQESENDPHDVEVLKKESDDLEDSLRRMQAGKEAMDDIPKEVRKLLAA